ncbi:FkbM family methyltransferase [Tenacibaculum amylolyticum]|uniref:FkbM family methyltransferase n=1 Tax=Tenacibaculum amylolyticum TaxID=104269 RepID=UPI00389454DE
MKLIELIRKLINPLHMDLVKYPDLDLRRRKKLLDYHQINKILDVGANAGQYASQVFELGFKGTIISFEPLSEVYNVLEGKAAKNDSWKTYNHALGSAKEEVEINVSQNTFSSSILDILPSHVNSAPASKYIKKEKISVEKLDDVFEKFYKEQDNILLKIDVQGFEKQVLEGAIKSLDNIKGIQVEMSVEELYKGEMLFNEMVNYLHSFGFTLHSLENGFYNEETGKLLQVDGIFFKS